LRRKSQALGAAENNNAKILDAIKTVVDKAGGIKDLFS